MPFDRGSGLFLNAVTSRGAGLVAFVMVAGALGGCVADPDVPVVAVRDSLGIAIVEVDRDQVGKWGEVDPSPEWVIGSDGAGEGNLVLHGVADVDVSEDIVWIAHSGSQEVIGVQLDGDEVVRMGGAGDGPREFRRVSRVWNVGSERVGAFDHARQRYLEFTRSGDLVRQVQMPVSSETGDLPRLFRVPRADGGEMFYRALVTGLPTEPSDGPYRGRGPLVRLADSPDTITWIAGNTTFVGDQMAGGVLFGATSLLAEGPEGIWVGDTERPEVTMWRDKNEPVRVVRWRGPPPERVTASRMDQLWDRLERSAPEQEREMVGQLRQMLPFAERVPEFSSLHLSPEGVVWVGEYVGPEHQMLEEPWPTQEWLVIDVAAGVAGSLVTPGGLRVLQVGRDFVVGVHTDELGVETVRLHRLELDDPGVEEW
jgi:hypothetical protein